jgi:BlaI family penicillinase repressor
MPDQSVELTEAEWAIIKTIWRIEPTTAPAVQEALAKQTGWTYSTVRTFMDRMTAKGLLKADKRGKVTLFTSAITRDEAQRGELLYALKHAFNGALTPMVQCLLESQKLSDADLAELEALLRQRKRRTK